MRHLTADFEEVTNGVGGPARAICAVHTWSKSNPECRASSSSSFNTGSLVSQEPGLLPFVLAVILASYHVGVVGSGNPNSGPPPFFGKPFLH